MFAFNGSHLMPSGTFSATLTTKAFDPSRLRWLATRSCKPVARGRISTCCRSLSHLLRRLLRHTLVHAPVRIHLSGEAIPSLLEFRERLPYGASAGVTYSACDLAKAPQLAKSIRAILTAHLSPGGQQLLANCFGMQYMNVCNQLLSLDWLHAGRVHDNLEKTYRVKL
jgi:hypothetical protein